MTVVMNGYSHERLAAYQAVFVTYFLTDSMATPNPAVLLLSVFKDAVLLSNGQRKKERSQ